MSGILIVSGRPRPPRLTATVKDAVPPPPRELPRINPVIPGTLVAVTLGVVYFSGLIQIDVTPLQTAERKPETDAAPAKVKAVVRRAPEKLPDRPFSPDDPSGLVAQVRRLAFSVARDPTTPYNFEDRLASLRSFFAILTSVDRSALFGVTEFSEVEQVLRATDPKAVCKMLDRLLMRLQFAFH